MKQPIILAIDTSCDDTAAAVTCGSTVLSNIVASQTELHRPYGGVFPTVAKQAHRENIAPVIATALRRAQVVANDIDVVAVTQGPGLAPALEVGISAAFEFAQALHKPILAVNHLEGHMLSVLAQPAHRVKQKTAEQPRFPALAVVVSGKSSSFILVSKLGKYKVLGSTLDDAAGECLDKIGRMLNLGYPAGPVIEEFAKLGQPERFPFPLPLTAVKTFDLSFSGLKTHARKVIEALVAADKLDRQTTYDLCAAAQMGVFKHITYKLERLLTEFPIAELWLGGGVAANVTLRTELRRTAKRAYHHAHTKLRVPYSKRLCMDNAAMIGVTAGLTIASRTPAEHIDRAPRLKLGESTA